MVRWVRSQRVQELQALGAVDADAVAGAVYWISVRLACLMLERIVVLCLGVRFTVRCGSGAHAPAFHLHACFALGRASIGTAAPAA